MGNSFTTNSYFEVIKLQKLLGNEIRLAVRSICASLFPIFSNWCENISGDRSFCRWTSIFVVKFGAFMCRQKVAYFRQPVNSSAGVDREELQVMLAWNLQQAILLHFLDVFTQIFQWWIKRFERFFMRHCVFMLSNKFEFLQYFSNAKCFANVVRGSFKELHVQW